jgi:hypothetical protein
LTTSLTNQSASSVSASGQLLRPGRALIGWMPAPNAYHHLASSQVQTQPSPEDVARVEAAHNAVLARPTTIDQTTGLQDVPQGLNSHVESLKAAGSATAFFNEGWSVRIADLRRVCAFQPLVFSDSAVERLGQVDPTNMVALAELTLPTVSQQPPPNGTFDQAKNAFTVVSANPNLRIVGHVGSEVATASGKFPCFGFLFSVSPSFMQVAEYQGRLLLRDGYHRAIGLLASGVTTVPVFHRSFASIGELVPPGMLPQEAFLGDRPPLLPDYLDDSVSALVQMPALLKTVVIHGLETVISGGAPS